MSDTGKTILWIVVAVVVIAVIIWLFASARRSKEADARRFEAAELRAQVQERLPNVQNQEDRASVTDRLAAEARAEAHEKALAARSLEEQAEQHRAAAAAARAEHEDLARRADLVDPDVPTDSEGYLVDDSGHRLAGQGPSEPSQPRPDEPAGQAGRAGWEPRAATLGAGAGAVAAGALGAAYTHDEDDEQDLADAENPFAASAPAGSEPAPAAASEPERAAAAPEPEPEAPAEAEREAEAEAEPEAEAAAKPDAEPEAEAAAKPDAGPDAEAAESVEPAESAQPVEPGAPGAPAESVEPAESAERTESAEPAAEQGEPTESAEPAAEQGEPAEPAETNLETTSPAAAVAEAVPALHDKDTHVVLGGTPGDDPGDHRGQPWATTPGVPGLEQDTAEPEVQEPQPALDTGQGVEGLGGQDDQSAPQPNDETDDAADASSGRRISTFEEVADGGFGIGSAAPIADGVQPLGHAVKGTRDGRTFLAPGDDGYDDVEPDVWFYNEEAARRAGFNREGDVSPPREPTA